MSPVTPASKPGRRHDLFVSNPFSPGRRSVCRSSRCVSNCAPIHIIVQFSLRPFLPCRTATLHQVFMLNGSLVWIRWGLGEGPAPRSCCTTTQHTPKPNDEPTERLKLSRCAVPAAAVHRTPESAPRFDGLSRSRVAPGFGFVILCQRSLVPRPKRAREKPEGACLALNRLLPRVG